jgi:hypothetical protein
VDVYTCSLGQTFSPSLKTSIAIQIFPGTESFQPVKRLQDIAIKESTALPEGQVITAPIVHSRE